MMTVIDTIENNEIKIEAIQDLNKNIQPLDIIKKDDATEQYYNCCRCNIQLKINVDAYILKDDADNNQNIVCNQCNILIKIEKK